MMRVNDVRDNVMFKRSRVLFVVTAIFLTLLSGMFVSVGRAEDDDDSEPADEVRQELIDLALSHLGDPYTWGKSQEDTSDCSGFMNLILSNTGFDGFVRSDATHGPTSRDQYNTRVDHLSVSTSDLASNNGDNLLPGDLLFLRDPKTGQVYHVGMYIGNGKTIEQGGLRDDVNIQPLSRWSSPTYWAGAGRIKTAYWPNQDRGHDEDADFDTDAEYSEVKTGTATTTSYDGSYMSDEGLEDIEATIGGNIQYTFDDVRGYDVEFIGGDKGVVPIVVDLKEYGPNSFLAFSYAAIDWIIRFALTLVILAIVYSGFLFLTSAGRESRVTLARRSVRYIIIGFVILMAVLAVKGALMVLESFLDV